MNNNHLYVRLHELADEMDDTDYTDLRQRVDSSARRIRRRRVAATTAAGIAAVAVVTVGGWAAFGRTNHGPQPAVTPTGTAAGTPSTGPSAVTSPTAPASATAPAVPTALPGTLVYLDVIAGKPITMTTVTDGVAHQTVFGTATHSNELYPPMPSPDATRLAVVESPDPDNLAPGDLVIISAGGSRHTLAHNVVGAGGGVPVWSPDGKQVTADVAGKPTVVDVTTGATTPAMPLAGGGGYLTWSANGQWRAYGGSTDVTVTAPDGTGAVKKSVASLPECQATAGCPTSVQAVSDDGRYVALGHMNSDPSHVNEAHLVLDMRTGKLVNLPPVTNGGVDKIWFRPDGVMVVRTAISGKATFVLVRADGSTLASFPDTTGQSPSYRQLVAYRP